MTGFDRVAAAARDLPEVETGTWYGTPALKVRGKGFCRMWSEREHARDGVSDTEVLVVLCDIDEKPALIDSFDGVVFSTPHDDGHGAMLVRLADIADDDLGDLLEDSYRLKAPAALIRGFDGVTTD